MSAEELAKIILLHNVHKASLHQQNMEQPLEAKSSCPGPSTTSRGTQTTSQGTHATSQGTQTTSQPEEKRQFSEHVPPQQLLPPFRGIWETQSLFTAAGNENFIPEAGRRWEPSEEFAPPPPVQTHIKNVKDHLWVVSKYPAILVVSFPIPALSLLTQGHIGRHQRLNREGSRSVSRIAPWRGR